MARDRQKRKRRQAERAGTRDAVSERYARGREKDEAVRESLEPLEPGERPGAVTVAAIVAFLFGLGNIISYAAGLEIRGDRPPLTGILVYSGLMFLTAWGMWRARYWAVLGMETLLAIIVLLFSLLAVRSENVLELLIALAAILSAGSLFWYLIKAMARIQMPERPGASR